jgi:hypothetical protein
MRFCWAFKRISESLETRRDLPAARYGTMSTGDIIDSQVLVSKTADGVDLGSLWDEFTELLDVYTTTPPSSATC